MSISQAVSTAADIMACCSPLTAKPLTVEETEQIAPVLRALAEPVRLLLISLVASHDGGEAFIWELNDAVRLAQPTISHHMKVLQEAGLVDRGKRGTLVYYRLRPQALASLGSLIGCPPPSSDFDSLAHA